MRWMVIFCLVLVGTIAVVMNACDNVRLAMKQQNESLQSVGEICAALPDQNKHYTKIMFLVDKSGSNNDFTDANGTVIPGTDPKKQYRFNLLNDFVNKNRYSQDIQWGFVAFFDQGAKAYINGGNYTTPKFGTAADMDNALNEFSNQKDEGRTPYKAAMTMAKLAITNDRIQNAQGVSSTYVVVLISDGAPSDYMKTGSNDLIDEDAIDADVRSLTAVDTTLSTVYYGASYYTNEALRLERMARTGGGKFSNVNVDGKIPVDSLIKFGTAEPWIIKRFVVTNLNSAPCDDGTIDTDSDGDGLCDKDEIRYNTLFSADPVLRSRMNGKLFDPVNRNSFNSVYNDLIYYRRIVYNEELDLNCTDTTDEDKDLLNFCEERFIKSKTPNGPTTYWSGQMLTDADPKNPDSDGDGFLDFHELVFSPTRLPADLLQFTSVLKLVKDNFAMEQVLLEHRNPRSPLLSIPYDGKFEFSRVNENGQNCYIYTQTVLPLYPTKTLLAGNTGGRTELAHAEGENNIMIYFVQTAEKENQGPGELRYRIEKKKVSDGTFNFNLDVGLYESYLANGARVSPTRSTN